MTDDRGFTLIEILVALAIFAVSAAVLFRIVSGSLERAAENSNRAVATAHLQSLIAEAGTTLALKPGVATGDFGDGFRWRLRIAPASRIEHAPVRAMTVEARVSWQDGDRVETRSLQTLRLVTSTP